MLRYIACNALGAEYHSDPCRLWKRYFRSRRNGIGFAFVIHRHHPACYDDFRNRIITNDFEKICAVCLSVMAHRHGFIKICCSVFFRCRMDLGAGVSFEIRSAESEAIHFSIILFFRVNIFCNFYKILYQLIVFRQRIVREIYFSVGFLAFWHKEQYVFVV